MTAWVTDPVLAVRDLTVAYGGVVAVEDVSFDVAEGAIVGLIGPNGAGKTTCIDTLTGFTRARRGHLTFRGEQNEDLGPHLRARRGLVRTFQSLELFDDLTVRENLLVATGRPGRWSSFADALRRRSLHDPRVDEVLAELDLEADAETLPGALSNGRRHLVALARALVARPHLVLLDEPAAGLDPAETAALGEILRRLPALGTSILLVDHDMALVLGACDEIHVLDFGRRIASGSPAEIRTDPAVITAYLGRQEHDAPEFGS